MPGTQTSLMNILSPAQEETKNEKENLQPKAMPKPEELLTEVRQQERIYIEKVEILQSLP